MSTCNHLKVMRSLGSCSYVTLPPQLICMKGEFTKHFPSISNGSVHCLSTFSNFLLKSVGSTYWWSLVRFEKQWSGHLYADCSVLESTALFIIIITGCRWHQRSGIIQVASISQERPGITPVLIHMHCKHFCTVSSN